MIVRRLALASLLFSPLAWGVDATPPDSKSVVLTGAQILPIKVTDASKSAGGSLKPDLQKKEAVDVTAVLRRSFDDNGHPHYHCDAEHSAISLDLASGGEMQQELP